MPSKFNSLKKQTDIFLSSHGMNPKDIDLKMQIKLFIEEMESGLSGKKSSLSMLPTYLQIKKRIPKKKRVLVFDAGGTNLRSAIVSLDENCKPVIENVIKSNMPGAKTEVTREEFFQNIVRGLGRSEVPPDKIGFVFSYPVKMYPNKDGKLLHFTKEIRAPEVEGEFIGRNMIIAMEKEGINTSKKKVILLNDTTATLFSGVAAFHDREFKSFAGFVLGTGMNSCYVEKNALIKKGDFNYEGTKGTQLINIEAGNYSRGQRGEIDIAFDKNTLNPGQYTYEKMFSGAYLGGLASEMLRFAASDGLFSKDLSNAIEKGFFLSSSDIDDYLFYPPKNTMKNILDIMSDSDRLIIFYLFDALIERAAALSAIVMSSLLKKTEISINPCKPYCIIAEGSSFYKMKNFMNRIYPYIKKCLSNEGLDYYYEIKKVAYSVMLGGAVAALTN